MKSAKYILMASALLLALPAFAQTREENAAGGAAVGGVGGAATGAAVGTVVGGPVGTVVGAIIGGTTGAATGAAIGSVAPEDRVYIQRYVYERPVQPVVVRERVAVGEPLPPAVTTYEFAERPSLRGYRYAYVNNQYVLVDTRGRVMGAIER